MFNPTIELQKVNPETGDIDTILTKEIQIDDKGFPEIVIWKDETFVIEDWEPRIHAIYTFTPHVKLAYEPFQP